MHAREPVNDAAEREASARLGRALARLPELDPPEGAWSRIESRLATRQGAPVWLPTVAVATCALLVAVALVLRAPTDVPAPELAGPPDTVAAVEHAEWQRRSSELERLLAALPEAQLTRGSTALTAALLEDRIALVDERLNAHVGDAGATDQRDALLRERVLLLDSLVRVRYAAAIDASL